MPNIIMNINTHSRADIIILFFFSDRYDAEGDGSGNRGLMWTCVSYPQCPRCLPISSFEFNLSTPDARLRDGVDG